METNHGPRSEYPSDLTILHLLARHATVTPDALALVELEPSGGAHTAELSFAQMQAAVDHAAGVLVAAALGADPGARWVMIVLPEGLEQVLAVWAAMREDMVTTRWTPSHRLHGCVCCWRRRRPQW